LVIATGSALRTIVIVNITTASSSRFSVKAWTISFCIHAVAMAGTIGLVRGIPAQVPPPPPRLDFLLVEEEAPPASEPGQSTENQAVDPALAELEALSAAAMAHTPVSESLDAPTPEIATATAHPFETPSRTAPTPQEIARTVTNTHETSLDAPQPITQPHPVPASTSEDAFPSVSAQTDQPSPPAQHESQQAQAADTVDHPTDPPSADPSTSPALKQDQADTADATDQLSSASTHSPAHMADSAQETPGPSDALAAAAGMNHPSTGARASSPRSDYSWLTAALRRRVESLKTYPHLARVQGWGGRVVVRATIKDDGSLLDARVIESSGYEILDDEAIQLMHRAFPIHLQRDIGKPQVAVMVPIQYRTER